MLTGGVHQLARLSRTRHVVSGRYDDLKSADENIDLQSTILSRFDLIFIVKDERNAARDMQIAQCADPLP